MRAGVVSRSEGWFSSPPPLQSRGGCSARLALQDHFVGGGLLALRARSVLAGARVVGRVKVHVFCAPKKCKQRHFQAAAAKTKRNQSSTACSART